jgi:hypothetical protein
VPFGRAGFEQTPVVGLHVRTAWHWSGPGQTTGLAPVHVPPWQVSVCVHASPSSHAASSGRAGFEQAPVAGLQVPARWHWSDAVQTTGLAPVHVPPWQVSVCVHASPSSHAASSGRTGFEQTPVDGLHVPAVWHWSGAGQTTGRVPVQVPPSHVSVCVHAFPSSQSVPSARGGFEHAPVPGSQVPAA